MSLEEAVPIVKEKLTRMEDPLTDEERMAFYVWSLAYMETHWDFYSDSPFNKWGRYFKIATDPACTNEEVQKIFEQLPWKSDTLHGFGGINLSSTNYIVTLHDEESLPKLSFPPNGEKYGNNGSMTVLTWNTVGNCDISFEMYQGTLDNLRRTTYKDAPLKELLRHLYSLELVRFVALDMSYSFDDMQYAYRHEDTYIFGDKIF